MVIKLLEGTQGIGVVLAETDQAAKSVIEAFRGLDANILVQEFIAEAKGADLRCFVIGDKVVASMKRQDLLFGPFAEQLPNWQYVDVDGKTVQTDFTVPTALLVGTADTKTPPRLAAELAALLPDAQLVSVPDVGHMTPLEEPDVLADLILAAD